jgi:hypothetical protein
MIAPPVSLKLNPGRRPESTLSPENSPAGFQPGRAVSIIGKIGGRRRLERCRAMHSRLLTLSVLMVGCAPAVAVGPRLADGTNVLVRLASTSGDAGEEGLALAAVGDYAGAAVGFRRAVELDPIDDGALFNLGLMREKLGDFPRARDAYRAAIALADRGKYREGLLRVLNRLDLDAGRVEPAVRSGSGAEPARVEPPGEPGLKLSSDAVPPAPKSERPAEPAGPAIAAGRAGPTTDSKAGTAAEPPPTATRPPAVKAAVEGGPGQAAGAASNVVPGAGPVIAPARPRVLVLQAAPAAGDPPGRATGGAAELVEWKLSTAGGVLLSDAAALRGEPAARARSLEPGAEARRAAVIGRAAGADTVVLLEVTASADAAGAVSVLVRARVIEAAGGREGEPVTAREAGTGETVQAATAAGLRRACEQVALRLKARLSGGR